MLSTKDLYMKACMQSKELHAMTDEERTRLQAHLRMMYLEIEKVCDRHNLKMCTAYGTVLGALRHQGFIPWDDDMDLLMPREDYDKLINEYADELPKSFKIYSPNSKNGPIYRFAKVVDTKTRFLTPGAENTEKKGIFIDIFPLENALLSERKTKLFRFYTMFLMYVATSVDEYKSRNKEYKKMMCLSLDGKTNYYFRNFIGFLFSWRTPKGWYNRFDRFVTGHKYCGCFNIPSGGPHIRNFVPRKVEQYIPFKKMKFDEIDVYVPNNPEQHCVDYYGDWKQIPPVDQRWQHFIKEIKFEV